jgi:hypothetical protein
MALGPAESFSHYVRDANIRFSFDCVARGARWLAEEVMEALQTSNRPVWTSSAQRLKNGSSQHAISRTRSCVKIPSRLQLICLQMVLASQTEERKSRMGQCEECI